MRLPVIEGTFLQASCKACRIQSTVTRGTAAAATPGFKVLAYCEQPPASWKFSGIPAEPSLSPSLESSCSGEDNETRNVMETESSSSCMAQTVYWGAAVSDGRLCFCQSVGISRVS
ncbi:hypothetical protein QQF64_000973 [Cirrhinus molitorella]|uniref:Uncharacterized protein n=1 Tax=Cirrhinus molitorella TaxID=172907 RepID=A0ABR3NZ69_9TELE